MANIDSGGELTALTVNADQAITVTASYSGKSDTCAVIIKDSGGSGGK